MLFFNFFLFEKTRMRIIKNIMKSLAKKIKMSYNSGIKKGAITMDRVGKVVGIVDIVPDQVPVLQTQFHLVFKRM